MAREKLILDPDRFFDPDATVRKIARQLYESVKEVPIVSPHGHVDPRLFADEDASFGNPTELMVIPDHYLFRMLYSQGIAMESLGVKTIDGAEVETDPRRIWQIVGEHFHLFRGTPTGAWLDYEFSEIFGIKYRLTGETAMEIYDAIDEKLKSPEFSPRGLFERFRIEVLCTTDAAADTLKHHQAIRDSGWNGRILPTFRPDSLIHLGNPRWKENVEELSRVSGIDVQDYRTLIEAVEGRRRFFRSMGAAATDCSTLTPYTAELSPGEADEIFQRALKDKTTDEDSARFQAHMLMEMARMSVEDGLVMQLHTGSFRNHNRPVYDRFGPDAGCDIPVQVELTENLRPLLNKYGNDPGLTFVVFTLDESTYSRELAPLAGHYPAMRLGPPWWFHDSINGMTRYRQRVMETAGLYNTAGFNDDTRAFPSIPARHDLSRRVDANWLAGLVARHIITLSDAREMIQETAYRLAKTTYKL